MKIILALNGLVSKLLNLSLRFFVFCMMCNYVRFVFTLTSKECDSIRADPSSFPRDFLIAVLLFHKHANCVR